MNKILIGFKNCGKTTYGRMLAEKKGCQFIDSDELIEKYFNDRVRTVYERIGEESFREIESQLIDSINYEKESVIALGGGAKISNKRNSVIIYLKVEKDILKERFLTDSPKELVKNNSSFESIYSDRVEYYKKISDYVIDLKSKSDDVIISELISVR